MSSQTACDRPFQIDPRRCIVACPAEVEATTHVRKRVGPTPEDSMSDETLNRLLNLPDAEIEKYLPASVPLRLYAKPIEELTGLERSIERLHRTMLACHAERCAALEALAESRRQAAAKWNRLVTEFCAEMNEKAERNRELMTRELQPPS
jgi:hypothetical protein